MAASSIPLPEFKVNSNDRDSLGRFANGSKGHAMPHTEESKLKMSIAKKGRRISPKTEFKKGQSPWNKGLKGVQKPPWLGKKRPEIMGDKNPSWKGGITSLQTKLRNSTNMKNWRNSVMKRDQYTCFMCGQVGGRLQADHVYPFSKILRDVETTDYQEILDRDSVWDINNGRTVCYDCHRKIKNIGEMRMAGKSPTQRTMEYLREEGMECCVTERWMPNPKHPAGGFRKDMFGFGDIVALGENSIIAIQSCGQSFSEHNKKITEDELVAPNALKWLECGGRLLLIGWRKVKLKRGGKAMRWQPRIKEYQLSDFGMKGG